MFEINYKKISELSELIKNINFQLSMLPGIEKAIDISDAKK